MIVVIDTSSLLALVRYYGRFDKTNKMQSMFKTKIENGEIVVVDEVLNECKGTSKGIVVEQMDYLIDKDWKKEFKVPFNTSSLIAPAPQRFMNQVDNNFKAPGAKKLSEELYEVRKREFLESADMKMILYCLNQKYKNPDLDIRIVTEETDTPNDNKAFKKIPSICKTLNIKVSTLPEYLDEIEDIKLEFN